MMEWIGWFVFANLCFVICIAIKAEDEIKQLKDLTKRAENLSGEFDNLSNKLDDLEKIMEGFYK